MKLKEFEGIQLFEQYHIPVPKYYRIHSIKDAQEHMSYARSIVKGQILMGKRKKHGAIKFATKKTLMHVVKSLLHKKIKGLEIEELLVEERIAMKQQLYVSLVINRSQKEVTLVFSKFGGVDVETYARKSKKKFIQLPLTHFNHTLLAKKLPKIPDREAVLQIIFNMHALMKTYDATLVEINPLVYTGHGYVAADCKIILDDNATYRQEIIQHIQRKKDVLEEQAQKAGLSFVPLHGDIGIIGNGAGLVMATLDMLTYYNGKPANFLDVGGGASQEKLEQALNIVMQSQPKGIFINIFGGITQCDEIAKGIVEYSKKRNIKTPMVVRMIGTHEEQAQRILKKANIKVFESMDEAARAIVQKMKKIKNKTKKKRKK